jgi:hypothetical protein
VNALLSILTLYNHDNSIFENFQIPQQIDKETTVNNLLMELAELEIIYTNPDMMKFAIGAWSKKELPIWQKLANTLNLDYNPLENLYRTEEYKDKETRDLSGSNNETRNLAGSDNEVRNLAGTDNQIRNLTGTDNETRDLNGTDNETRDIGGSSTKHSETSGDTTNKGNDTTKEYTSGFNEATPTLAKQIEQTLGSGNSVTGIVDTTDSTTDTGTVNKTTTDEGTVNKSMTDSGTINNASTDTGTVNKSMTDSGTVNRALTDTGTIDKTQDVFMHGSIGVITPQQMIEQERKVVQFNVMDYIIKSFKNRFCIQRY